MPTRHPERGRIVRTSLPVMILIMGCVLLVDPMFAQETSEDWTFRVTPYFVGAGSVVHFLMQRHEGDSQWQSYS